MASIGCEVLMYSASHWALIYSHIYGSWMASCRFLCLSFFSPFFQNCVIFEEYPRVKARWGYQAQKWQSNINVVHRMLYRFFFKALCEDQTEIYSTKILTSALAVFDASHEVTRELWFLEPIVLLTLIFSLNHFIWFSKMVLMIHLAFRLHKSIIWTTFIQSPFIVISWKRVTSAVWSMEDKVTWLWNEN